MKYHSTTSQYGTLTRAADILNDEIKEKARHNFVHDIKVGAFVEEWTKNNATASQRLKELWEQALSHPMSQAEDRVIQMLQAADETDV